VIQDGWDPFSSGCARCKKPMYGCFHNDFRAFFDVLIVRAGGNKGWSWPTLSQQGWSHIPCICSGLLEVRERSLGV
jgi:hypothetical protein